MNQIMENSIFRIIHEKTPIVCIDVVLIMTDGGFLMIKRKEEPAKDQWWLPGGRVLKNESLVSAARRKVLEETSLRIKSLVKIVEGYELLFREDPFAHGFITLSEVSELLYKTTDYYAPQFECCISWDDPSLNIDWQLHGIPPSLSEKDKQGVEFRNIEYFT